MTKLSILRKSIDQVDKQLVKLLARRVRLVKEVGKYKKENREAIRDPKRELVIIKNKVAAAKKLGLSATFVKKLWKLLFEESYKIEK
ncbi:hypothetical protein CMO96_04005 [Candidatus Woesebacteria bacterium]|nr:hypothetical protein [Candidatus Woesebacteria bacterium]|tara:strand:+ start:222 stop:482 length:261 start_codon:yes stop_codon:yes gene_type:complete